MPEEKGGKSIAGWSSCTQDHSAGLLDAAIRLPSWSPPDIYLDFCFLFLWSPFNWPGYSSIIHSTFKSEGRLWAEGELLQTPSARLGQKWYCTNPYLTDLFHRCGQHCWLHWQTGLVLLIEAERQWSVTSETGHWLNSSWWAWLYYH